MFAIGLVVVVAKTTGELGSGIDITLQNLYTAIGERWRRGARRCCALTAARARAGLVNTLSPSLTQVAASVVQFASVAGFVHRVARLVECLDEWNEVYKEFEKEGRVVDSGARCGRARCGARAQPHARRLADNIETVGLTVTTPDGQPLVRNLSVTVSPGKSLIIMGPSGCGKSSLLRVLGGLWPFPDGTLRRPAKVGRDGMFFVPQSPYIVRGTLRDQILYPHTAKKQVRAGEGGAARAWWPLAHAGPAGGARRRAGRHPAVRGPGPLAGPRGGAAGRGRQPRATRGGDAGVQRAGRAQGRV